MALEYTFMHVVITQVDDDVIGGHISGLGLG